MLLCELSIVAGTVPVSSMSLFVGLILRSFIHFRLQTYELNQLFDYSSSFFFPELVFFHMARVDMNMLSFMMDGGNECITCME